MPAAVTEKEAATGAVTVSERGWVEITGENCTVRVATLLVTEPELFSISQRNCALSSEGEVSSMV